MDATEANNIIDRVFCSLETVYRGESHIAEFAEGIEGHLVYWDTESSEVSVKTTDGWIGPLKEGQYVSISGEAAYLCRRRDRFFVNDSSYSPVLSGESIVKALLDEKEIVIDEWIINLVDRYDTDLNSELPCRVKVDIDSFDESPTTTLDLQFRVHFNPFYITMMEFVD